MTYVPIVTTRSNLEDSMFRNILRIVDEHQVSNSSIIVQDSESTITFPNYTLFIPQPDKVKRRLNSSSQNIRYTMQIDFCALPDSGAWSKVAEMYQKLEDGFDTEYSNLHIARLDYVGSEVMSNEPLLINDQQVFCKSVMFEFVVMI